MTGKPNPVVSFTSVNQTSRKERFTELAVEKAVTAGSFQEVKATVYHSLVIHSSLKFLWSPHMVLNNPLITKLAARLGVTDAPKA